MNLLRRPISSQKFMECVFADVRKALYDRALFTKDLAYIDEILNSTTLAEAEKENLLIPFYLRLEKYISEEQSKRRIPAQQLREMIRASCHPERCMGDFAILFLPPVFSRMRLFERFSEDILSKSISVIPDVSQVFMSANEFLSGVWSSGKFDWSGFENRISGIPNPEEREENARHAIGVALEKVFDRLNDQLEVLRTEIIFRDSFKKMKERFRFLDGEVPQILQVVPTAIMQEERPEMFSKEKLSDELKRRNSELEFTLSRLSEEKSKVESERAQLEIAVEELKKLDAAKDQFIGIISHQFRTPLSAIRWNNDLISEELAASGISADKLKTLTSYSGAIMSRSVFLIGILEDIFDVLAIENRKLTIERKPGLLWEVVDSAVSAVSPEAKLKNIRINFNKAEASLKSIQFDSHKVERACSIMLRNAVNYSRENSEVTVSIGTMDYNGRPAQFCTIRDSGIGISAEDMPNLFTKFFRAKNAIITVADGAGLGLYLVKNFIEGHGGAVGVESELGKGSAFSFILPEE